jgi:hypothetical protein
VSAAQYREEQPAIVVRIALGATMLISLGLAIALPVPLMARLVLCGVALLECALLALMWTFRIEVTRTEVSVAFGPGWIRRRYPLSTIRAAELARTLSAGVRARPHVVTWSGKPGGAVALDLDSGWRVLIGSEKPERLLAAIESARAHIGR